MTDATTGGKFDLACTAVGFNFLSPEVKTAMKVSLPVLQGEYGFAKMYLWGKLKGMTADYLIAVGVMHSLKEPTKKYFYCSDGATWAQMPEPESPIVEACRKIPTNVNLNGDPQFQYNIKTEVPEGEEPPENEEELDVSITEDVRVAFIVKEIEGAIAMIPAGAIVPEPKLGIPMINSMFTGLAQEESLALTSWELLSGLSASQQLAGSLKAKYIPAHDLTVLRSLLWPGFAAYTVPRSSTWGYVYVGDGKKNDDIAFSLP
mmetsp:Transcript_13487/g.35985  ORF Transcript_13487/g.35985 Transcript_13487/m.35985 type:complete len:261 (+) Transcript_13487:41-823(+)